MDIHRCRFVPYPLSPINSLAFSHRSDPSLPPPRSLRLAIGRANGDIELWNPAGGLWVQEQILHAGTDRSIEGLIWTQDPDSEDANGNTVPGNLRLFSIGYSTVITEWDLLAGRPLRHSSGNYGEIWCISTQPRPRNGGKGGTSALYQKVVVGCADGALVIFSANENEITYSHKLPPPSNRRARVLSIAWRNMHTVVAGYSDGCIRIFDIRGRGRLLETLSLGSSVQKGKSSEILVWSVRCLSDGAIVSGDSTGEIKVWDSTTLALLQRLRGHEADVLDVATSLDGQVLVSGGIDRRTVFYRRAGGELLKNRWAERSHQRLHKSDVKAIAAYEAKGFSIVVSAGLDATAIVMPLQRHGLENVRRLAISPNHPPLVSAPAHRLIASWWEREIRIWALGIDTETQADDGVGSEESPTHDLVSKIVIKGDESIVSCSMATDASAVVASTYSRTTIFRLKERPGSKLLKVSEVEIPQEIANTGSTLVSLSPDSQWLLRIRDGEDPEVWRVYWEEEQKNNITVESKPTKLKRRFQADRGFNAQQADRQSYMRSIHRVAWSADSKVIVSCDLSGHFDKWVFQASADGIGNNSRISRTSISDDESSEEDEPYNGSTPWARVGPEMPQLNSTPLILAFVPQLQKGEKDDHTSTVRSTRSHPGAGEIDEHQQHKALVVVTDDHQILELDVPSGQRSSWSRRNPPECLPLKFKLNRERAMGCVWDCTEAHRRIWIYGSSWLWMFDLSRDLPSTTRYRPQTLTKASNPKRRHGDFAGKDIQLLISKSAGAGSKIPEALRNAGIGTYTATAEDVEETTTAMLTEHAQTVKLNGVDSHDEMDVDDEGEDAAGLALLRLRRGSYEEGTDAGMNAGEADNEDVEMIGDEDEDDDDDEDGTIGHGPSHWGTLKYRPILGVVPVGSYGGAMNNYQTANAREIFKVALVERPLWQADLPQKWEGAKEIRR